MLCEPDQMFRILGGNLIKEELRVLEHGMQLTRITTGLPSLDATGKQKMMLISKPRDAIKISNHFQWKDGRDFFDTDTSHLRRMLYKGKANEHVSIVKWATQL